MQLWDMDPKNGLWVVGMVTMTVFLGETLTCMEWKSKAGKGESRWG